MYPIKKLSEVIVVLRNWKSCKQTEKHDGQKITRIETISAWVINDEKVGYFELTDQDKEKYSIKKGDILFSHINSVEHIWKIALSYKNYNDLFHGMNLLLLRWDAKIITGDFLYVVLQYYFKSWYWRPICKKAINQASLNQKNLNELKIPLPPLPTQQKIVTKLDEAFANIDRQIALIKSNIEDVENMRKSVLENIFNDSSIPKKTIQEIFKIKSWNFLPKSNMKESGEYHVYGGNWINGKHDQYNLDWENIIIGRVWALCGNVRLVVWKFWLTDNAFYISEYLIDNINKSYLKNILEFLKLWETANKAAQPVISYKSISSILIPLPTLPRQQEIVAHLDRVFAETALLQQVYYTQISDLEKLKQSLLQDAFDGKFITE